MQECGEERGTAGLDQWTIGLTVNLQRAVSVGRWWNEPNKLGIAPATVAPT